jgi:dTDP-glucose 4,6-dehydratase
MNILVTGGCGFIGSNFINYMVEKYPKHSFFNIDCLNYCADVQNIHVSHLANYSFLKGNILSFDFISFILSNFKIDVIIHFAAQSHVDSSFENSFQYTNDNIVGTHTLLEASRQYGKLKKFIHISTDEVYGENKSVNDSIKSESSILIPTNPYAATKAAAEMIVMSYYKSFNLPIVITRGNNTYGPNQYPEKVIPKFIELLMKGKKCPIHGKGTALRNFLYVDDVVKAFEIILFQGNIGEIYNIGGDEDTEISVLDLAKLLISKIKGSFNEDLDIEYINDRQFNDQRYWITNAKLKELGWNPVVSLDKGLDKTIVFYKNIFPS